MKFASSTSDENNLIDVLSSFHDREFSETAFIFIVARLWSVGAFGFLGKKEKGMT